MRKAYTMIEIIFVILIIGILSSVAGPKLAASRDDGVSTVCVQEISAFVTSAHTTYARVGYQVFKDITASQLTHGQISLTPPSSSENVFINTKVDTAGVVYYCDGTKVVEFVGNATGGDYILTVSVEDINTVDAPVGKSVINKIKQNMLNSEDSKTYAL